jgi:mannose-6-phosphate isomerase-like protein (cupin superfamily)
LLEFKAAPGAEPLAHTHDNEDEFFYLVDGEMTFQVGDLTVEARAGSWVAVPRGTLHSFKARSEQVTLLVMYTPAGFERFFQELSVPAESLTTPPVLSGAPDVQKILSAGARNGCNFVKPF